MSSPHHVLGHRVQPATVLLAFSVLGASISVCLLTGTPVWLVPAMLLVPECGSRTYLGPGRRLRPAEPGRKPTTARDAGPRSPQRQSGSGRRQAPAPLSPRLCGVIRDVAHRFQRPRSTMIANATTAKNRPHGVGLGIRLRKPHTGQWLSVRSWPGEQVGVAAGVPGMQEQPMDVSRFTGRGHRSDCLSAMTASWSPPWMSRWQPPQKVYKYWPVPAPRCSAASGPVPGGRARPRICSSCIRAAICCATRAVCSPWKTPSNHPTSCA